MSKFHVFQYVLSMESDEEKCNMQIIVNRNSSLILFPALCFDLGLFSPPRVCQETTFLI